MKPSNWSGVLVPMPCTAKMCSGRAGMPSLTRAFIPSKDARSGTIDVGRVLQAGRMDSATAASIGRSIDNEPMETAARHVMLAPSRNGIQHGSPPVHPRPRATKVRGYCCIRSGETMKLVRRTPSAHERREKYERYSEDLYKKEHEDRSLTQTTWRPPSPTWQCRAFSRQGRPFVQPPGSAPGAMNVRVACRSRPSRAWLSTARGRIP